MSASKTLIRTSLNSLHSRVRNPNRNLHPNLYAFAPRFPFAHTGLGFHGPRAPPKPYAISESASLHSNSAAAADPPEETVEELLSKTDKIERLMKMERRPDFDHRGGRWFPYLDVYKAESGDLGSLEVIEALDPYILESRKERIRRAVENRSYSVCLVVEGLTDFGNVSAAFRSADALGIQSVHVISSGSKKRYRDNRHVSMGAEKWLDIELWNSPRECFEALRMRGYRIATTHLGNDTVSVHELDWSCPTAIVVGNEHLGISDEALQLSDFGCCIPMKGMVDSFNVSVAAGILMHHAVCDRVSRLGHHGDLTSDESRILLAEFFLRHRESTTSIVHEYAKRKLALPPTRFEGTSYDILGSNSSI